MDSMPFSVCLDAVYSGVPVDVAMRQIKSAGINAVEFWSWRDKEIDVIDKTRRSLQMTVAAFCTPYFELGAVEGHDRFLYELRETIDVAQKLDCRLLITQVGDARHDVPRPVQRAIVAEGLRRCVPVLEESGITLVFEPLNTAVDHPHSFLTTSEEAAAIARQVDSPFVKVLFDYYHQQISEGNLIAHSKEMLLSGQIGHIHCAGNPGRHEIDTGEIHYGAIFQMLSSVGYHGFVGLEYTPTTDPAEHLRTLALRYGGV